MPDNAPTLRVNLSGGQNRLRQLIIYVAKRCQDAERFGVIKLNKILWRADFESFARRGIPVTGREYRRLELGPAPKEMPTLQQEMRAQRLIQVEIVESGGLKEYRTYPLVEADLTLFSADDLKFIDESIDYYWDKTGIEASDDSHGAAWRSRNNGDLMPYELAYLADEPIGNKQFLRLRSLIDDEGMTSL